ncbi:MAG: two-component system, NarL family, nitrate/nitrite response regulator NarL [Chthoniobacter sp.]|nr:two-component system, NarL family, nitrate/nitrite response regulator NarL [Chthoniobacter sp.]
MLDKVVNGYRVVVVRKQTAPDSRVLLSPHEIEIARMIGKGLPNKTIAGVLEISSWTVGTHIRRIFAKLNVTSRAAMVTKMMELGMTENRHYAGAVAAAASAR